MKNKKSEEDQTKGLDIWGHITLVEERRKDREKTKQQERKDKKSKKSGQEEEEKDERQQEQDEEQQQQEQEQEEQQEIASDKWLVDDKDGGTESTYVLFVGGRGSGKSVAVSQFLNPSKADENPKPTVALEYTYGRRTNASGDRKDLCQIWELGGGDKLKDLIPVVITPEREPHSAIVITIDLSKPEIAFDEAVKWSKIVRKVSKTVPVMIFGTKYDTFQDQDGVKRKALCQALRYVACAQRCGLVFISTKDKTSLNYARAILNHYAFHAEKKKSFYVDPNKIIVVAPGKDSMEKIGFPSGLTPDTSSSKVIAAWQELLGEYFPKDSSEAKRMEDEENEENIAIQLSPEPVVDAARTQKDQELEHYKAQVARKQRLEKAK